MGKKLNIITVIVFALGIIFNTNNIGAKEVRNSKIKINYDNTNKILKAYGYNAHGNLGTGDYKEVQKENEVTLNNKIGNQKIVDYIFTGSQTYLLTSSGKVYATGYNIGDGKDNTRNTFLELKLYNRSKVKVTSLKLLASSRIFNKENDKSYISIEFRTNKKNIKYSFDSYSSLIVPRAVIGLTWVDFYKVDEYDCFRPKKDFIMYSEKKNANNYRKVFFNNIGRKIQAAEINIKKKAVKQLYYKKGALSFYAYKTGNKTISIYYSNNKLSEKIINNYKKKKDPSKGNFSFYSRYTYKQTTYYYKNGRLKQRNIKKFSNKKLRLYSKKFYYPNKNNQFKSNSNGNAYVYTTYYNRGKATVTYKYKLNIKGKMINKTKVNTKRKY